MRLVGLLSLLAFVSVGSSSLLGSKKCTWGPSYWCSHVSRAKECGAVDHCLQTVWTKQGGSTTNSNSQCAICEKMINMVREALKNMPVDEVITYIKELCDVLPFNQTYKTECINIVDDVDTVMKLLQSNMTAKAICGVVMPCSGFEDSVNHHNQPETNDLVQTPLVPAAPIKAGNICTDCVNFMTDIKNLLTDPNTESQLIGMIKQIVCAQLSSVETICDDLVDTYVPQGLSLLSSYVDPQVTCSAVGFCTGRDTQELRTKFRDTKAFVMVVLRKMGIHVTTNAVECDACKAVTNDVRNMARDPNMQRKIVDFVEENVCAHLGELATMCKQAVEDNYQAFFQLIAGSLVDDKLCIELGMCSNTLGAVKLQLGTIECEACTSIVQALGVLESSTTVQNALKNFIENDVCPKLGSSAAQCKTDVDMYSAAAFEILKEILNAGYLCGKMNLCAAPAPKLTSNGALCEVCDAVATELDNLLKDSDTQAKIEELLDSVCDRLSGNLSAQCKTFVDEYGPFVLNMLAQELNPSAVCKGLGFCPAKQTVKSTPPKAVSKTVKSNELCPICKLAVEEVSTLLKEKNTKAEVRQGLDDVCNKLGSLKDDCETFLNLYFDLVYNMLLNEADPNTVCTAIKLCSAKTDVGTVLPKHSSKLHIVPLSKGLGTLPTKTFNLNKATSSDECVICEMVMTYVAEALKEPTTVEAITTLLDMVCGKLPQQYQQMCNTFVDKYAAQVIQWLQHEDDPYLICPKLRLCATSKTLKKTEPKDTKLYFKKHIIAEKKCDQGPKYWCSSMSRARSCGKEDYCLKKNLINNLV